MIVDSNIKFSGKVKSTLEKSKEYFKCFKKSYVLCPVDKAGNNIAVVCKKYYLENIENELNKTDIYVPCDKSKDALMKSHVEFCQFYCIEVEKQAQKLPILYMMPKFHKNPVGYRYIASSVNTSLKSLSKLLTPILKSIMAKMKAKVNYEFKFKETSAFWIADNGYDLRRDLEHISNTKTASSIDCFDFKTLYTNIPHFDLKERIFKLVEETFNLKNAEYVNVWDGLRVSWGKKTSGRHSFTCENVKNMINFLLDNIFVKYKGKIFRQVVGIPMGCDCAPFLANLYLFTYEYEYIGKLCKSNDISKRQFRYFRRYIDDLCSPNGPDDFLKIAKDIYPDCLVLDKTNVSNNRVTFLDMEITVDERVFDIKLYDKRDDFSFNVLSMPNMSSNNPERQTYDIFYSQLFRLCHCNSLLCNFISDVKKLMRKLIHQRFQKGKLLKCLKKFLQAKHPCTFKYWEVVELSVFI